VGIDVQLIAVNRSVKGILNLTRCSRELDGRAPIRHIVHFESVRFQPRFNCRDVAVGRSKLFAELLGRQPLVEARRTLGLLRVEQCAQSRFLLGAPLQHQDHPFHGEARRRRSLIDRPPNQGMRVAAQCRQLRIVHGARDLRPRACRAHRGRGLSCRRQRKGNRQSRRYQPAE
jgi:hypothetical protein